MSTTEYRLAHEFESRFRLSVQAGELDFAEPVRAFSSSKSRVSIAGASEQRSFKMAAFTSMTPCIYCPTNACKLLILRLARLAQLLDSRSQNYFFSITYNSIRLTLTGRLTVGHKLASFDTSFYKQRIRND